MPTYAYRCESCGHQEDVRQKISEPHLTHCPNCAQDTFQRQLTAPNFQLKGSGWYVTDFRNGNQNSSGAKQPEASTSTQTTSEASASGSSKTDASAPQPTTTASSNSASAKESSTNKSTPAAAGS